MLSNLELERHFDHLGTPDEGRKLVRKARNESPVRKVQSNRGNVITKFCSRKMDRTIATESRTVEFPAAVMYEHDLSVLEYFPQPLRLDIVLSGKRGKAGRFQHTPDFLVIRKDGIWIEEWREESRLMDLAAKRPERYSRDEDGWRCPPAEEQFAAMGIAYRLRSADEHPRCFIQNMIFLANYLDSRNPVPDERFVLELRDLFRERHAIHLCELLEVEGFTADDIYKAITEDVVSFDLMNDLISDTGRTLVFRDEMTMVFHRKIGVAPLGEPFERQDASITVGGLVRYENQEYDIAMVGTETVVLKSNAGLLEMPMTWVMQHHRQGKLTVVSRPNESDPIAEVREKLSGFGPKALGMALQRAEWIKTACTAPESVPRSERTLQRYRSEMRRAGSAAIDQHLAIAPRYSACGYRERRIPEEIIELIAETVRCGYNTPTNVNIEWNYMDFVSACQRAGMHPCSRKTFAKELAKHRNVAQREGKRRAYQDSRVVHYLDLNESIHGVRPFQYVHIDHTELQIELCGPNSKKSLGRPWLSLAIDAESRSVVGFYLSFEPPSYRSCMMVLRDIVRRHGRMPDMLVLDNGKEFHSSAMQRVCALYGCHLRYRPSAQPRFGSVMERIFGTAQSQLINNMKGNTQVLRHARQATKSVLPENFVHWTLPGLHAAIDYYFVTLYGKEPHPAHGDGPVEHLQNRLIETGERRMRMVRFDDTFRIETCPGPRVGGETREVCIRRGVKVNHIWYWNDALRHGWLEGQSIPVRVDPWDVRYVFVLVGETWYRCRSKLSWLMRGYTELELRYAFEELAEKHSIKKKDLSPERVAEWMKVRDAANFDPRLATRQAEVRHVYDALGMTNVPDGASAAERVARRQDGEPVTFTPKTRTRKPKPARQVAIEITRTGSLDAERNRDDYDLL